MAKYNEDGNEVVLPVDSDGEVPEVMNTAPAGTEFGTVVRVAGNVATTGGPTPGTAATHASVAASAFSVTLKVANAARKGLYLRNTDAAPMYFRFGAGPALLSDPLYLLQEQVYEMPPNMSTAIVVGIWLAATGGTCEIEEIT
jgi:hypothetical protein